MPTHFCQCKQCKKMKRKGKVLGARMMGYWLTPLGGGKPSYNYMHFSDYVPHPRFAKGKRVRRPNQHLNFADLE